VVARRGALAVAAVAFGIVVPGGQWRQLAAADAVDDVLAGQQQAAVGRHAQLAGQVVQPGQVVALRAAVIDGAAADLAHAVAAAAGEHVVVDRQQVVVGVQHQAVGLGDAGAGERGVGHVRHSPARRGLPFARVRALRHPDQSPKD